MPPPLPAQELARRLLAHFADDQATPTQALAATDGVLRRLHAQLANWLGRDGANAVLARALDRTRGAQPLLAELRLDPRGEQLLTVPPGRIGVDDLAELREALVALLAAVLDLLARLIGADLVTRLVRQAWPGETFDETESAGSSEVRDELRVAARADDPNSPRMPDEDAPSD